MFNATRIAFRSCTLDSTKEDPSLEKERSNSETWIYAILLIEIVV